MGISLFFQTPNENTRGNNLKLYQGRFNLDIKKKFVTEMVVKYVNRLPREVIELFLEFFKNV